MHACHHLFNIEPRKQKLMSVEVAKIQVFFFPLDFYKKNNYILQQTIPLLILFFFLPVFSLHYLEYKVD